jgi:succinate dehydrogenase / fumarate reductase iron-sulfur subunit
VRLTLKIWRQAHSADKGAIHSYELDDVSPDMSFLEMLDVLNEELNAKGGSPSRSTPTAARVSVAPAR